jgi:2-methylcitrate dehydratase PrpD
LVSASLSARLAAWSNALRWNDVPEAQRELVHLRVLDSVGLIVRGAATEATAIARDVAVCSGGTGPATLAGAATGAPPGWAALVNGVAAHCWDFDDTFPESVVHPGSAIVPVALAVAETVGATGEETSTAIVAGYEIAARLAAYGGRRFHARGFHATGIFAPVCAAFVAARLLRLDAEGTASAVGLAASMAGGLLAFLPDGSWSKWLHLGWGNLGGITAARLAAGGFRGPLSALDGRHNLYEAFIGESTVNADAVLDELGTRWDNATSVFKYYPCAHVIQGYIDGALWLRERLPAPVLSVQCFVAPWAVPIVCEPRAEKMRPQTTMHAIASLPLHVASALIDGRVDIDTIGRQQRERADVLALMERIDFVEDESLNRFDARLVIATADGTSHEHACAVAPPDAERMREKFSVLTARRLGPERIASTIGAIGALAFAPDVRAVTGVFRAGD